MPAMLLGSDVAMVTSRLSRVSGTMECLRHSSTGTALSIPGGKACSGRLTSGTASCLDNPRHSIISSSKPLATSASPSLPPHWRW